MFSVYHWGNEFRSSVGWHEFLVVFDFFLGEFWVHLRMPMFVIWGFVSGFEILAFPCNQFLNQEPGTSEDAEQFACTRFKAEYPIFQKVSYFIWDLPCLVDWSILEWYWLMIMNGCRRLGRRVYWKLKEKKSQNKVSCLKNSSSSFFCKL